MLPLVCMPCSLRFTLIAQSAAFSGPHFNVMQRFLKGLISHEAKLIPQKNAYFPILEMTAPQESRQFCESQRSLHCVRIKSNTVNYWNTVVARDAGDVIKFSIK